MLSSGLAVLVLIFSPILYKFVEWLISTRRPANFPPGPRGKLISGNLYQIPKLLSFQRFDEWAKEFGPLTGIKLGPRNVVVINDVSMIHELIIKRANMFSARPEMSIAKNHILPDTWHTYGLFMRNDYSQRMRTVTKPFLNGAGLFNLAPVHKAGAAGLMYNILQSGENWLEHLNIWVFSTPVALMSGRSIKNLDANWVQDFQNTQITMTTLLDDPLERPWLSILPILHFIPFVQPDWKRTAMIARNGILRAYGAVMSLCEKSTHSKFQPLIARLRDQQTSTLSPDEQPLSEQEIKVMSGSLLLDAAVKSSLMIFQTILLAFASHPRVQKLAQAEIREAFGNESSIPDTIELNKLPYLNACILEALRWRPLGSYPIGPFGLPRESTADVEIAGYRIPKGTTVVINQWTIAHDPGFYSDPEKYLPERFMTSPVGAKPGVSQPGRRTTYAFGAGRRECPGKEYFLQNIRVTFALILWAFDIVPEEPLDTNPLTGFKPNVALKPNPFKVRFVPHSSEVAKTIEKEKIKADDIWKAWFD